MSHQQAPVPQPKGARLPPCHSPRSATTYLSKGFDAPQPFCTLPCWPSSPSMVRASLCLCRPAAPSGLAAWRCRPVEKELGRSWGLRRGAGATVTSVYGQACKGATSAGGSSGDENVEKSPLLRKERQLSTGCGPGHEKRPCLRNRHHCGTARKLWIAIISGSPMVPGS